MQMSQSGTLRWSCAPSSPSMRKRLSTCWAHRQRRPMSSSMFGITFLYRMWTPQHGR